MTGDSGLAINTAWAGFLPGGKSLVNLELRSRLGRRAAGSLFFGGASSTWDNSFEIGVSSAGGDVVEHTQVRGGLYGAALAFGPWSGLTAGGAGFFFSSDSLERYREFGLRAGLILRRRVFDLGAAGGFLQSREVSQKGPLVPVGSISLALRFIDDRILLSAISHLQEGEPGLFQTVERIWIFKNTGLRAGYDPFGFNVGLIGRWTAGNRHGLVEYSISQDLRHTLSFQLVWR